MVMWPSALVKRSSPLFQSNYLQCYSYRCEHVGLHCIIVVPAQAGMSIQVLWIPASAGMTGDVDSRLRGNDDAGA